MIQSPSAHGFNLSTYYALVWKCLIRRCKSPLQVFLEFGIPLAIFGLFSWAGSLLSTETTDPQIPLDAYAISSFGGDMYMNLKRGFTADTQPICHWGTYLNWQGREVEGWQTGDEDKLHATRILLDCEVHSLNTWVQAESNCGPPKEAEGDNKEGDNIFDMCQKKFVGIAPAWGLSASSKVAVDDLIASHISWLKQTWPESIGSHDLVKTFDSDRDMNDYVAHNDEYGIEGGDSPALAFGIIWHGAYPNFEYSIRLNETSVMDTSFSSHDHFIKNADYSFESPMCQKEGNRRKGLSSSSDLVIGTELGCNAGLYLGSGFAGIQHVAVDAFLRDYVSNTHSTKPLDFKVGVGVAGFPASAKSKFNHH